MSLPLFYSVASKDQGVLAYVRRLDWLRYAEAEMVTLVFPHGSTADASVCLFFQWTKNAKGSEKAAWRVATILHKYRIDKTMKATFKGAGSWYT